MKHWSKTTMGHAQRHESQALPATPLEDAPERSMHEIRLGTIKATIWRNVIGDAQAPPFNAEFSRLYHDGQRWRDSTSFGRDDLLLLADVSTLACLWIYEHGGGVAPE
jgi:hypothetical protein